MIRGLGQGYRNSDFAAFWARLEVLAKKRIRQKNWNLAHPDYAHSQYLKRRDVLIPYYKLWKRTHPMHTERYSMNYKSRYPGRRSELVKRWRKEHPEQWCVSKKRGQNRRERDYPTSIFLGSAFKGSVFHHITPDIVVAIPDSLHRSVAHNLRTGKGMDMINQLAMLFYEAPITAKPK